MDFYLHSWITSVEDLLKTSFLQLQNESCGKGDQLI